MTPPADSTEPKPEPAATPDRATPGKPFVTRSLNEFVRWSPLGGSGFAFASFLLRQDWAMAILLFPVTAISGIWGAYSKNFIETLTEKAAKRGKTDANALVVWMGSLDETLKWQFSGFETKYLQQQAKPCLEYTVEGFQGRVAGALA